MRTSSATACVAAFAACGGGQLADVDARSSGNVFTYAADAQGGYEGADERSFAPTTSRGWVSWEGTQMQGGTVRLQVFDGRGTAIYGGTAEGPTPPDGQATQVGEAGKWRLLLTFTRATGTIRFKIEGATGGAP